MNIHSNSLGRLPYDRKLERFATGTSYPSGFLEREKHKDDRHKLDSDSVQTRRY